MRGVPRDRRDPGDSQPYPEPCAPPPGQRRRRHRDRDEGGGDDVDHRADGAGRRAAGDALLGRDGGGRGTTGQGGHASKGDGRTARGEVAADGDHRFHAGRSRTFEHGFAVGPIPCVIQMGMGVDQHGAWVAVRRSESD